MAPPPDEAAALDEADGDEAAVAQRLGWVAPPPALVAWAWAAPLLRALGRHPEQRNAFVAARRAAIAEEGVVVLASEAHGPSFGSAGGAAGEGERPTAARWAEAEGGAADDALLVAPRASARAAARAAAARYAFSRVESAALFTMTWAAVVAVRGARSYGGAAAARPIRLSLSALRAAGSVASLVPVIAWLAFALL
jgi:hypothetical protein